ncbi:MAG: hypothetical protein WCR07_09540 [Verrucomicrobiota bacterium]|jgi:hypothetical protein
MNPGLVSPLMSAFRRSMACLVAVGSLVLHAVEKLPIQADAARDRVNYRSVGGLPLSATADMQVGSDGRAPANGTENASGSFNEATPGQFLPWMPFSGGAVASDWVTRSLSSVLSGSTSFANAMSDMQLPTGRSGTNVVVAFRKVRIGSPYLSKATPYSFGSVIEVPDLDEAGQPLNVLKERYWIGEPHTTNSHANAGYYWSPHAGKVYAIQAGPVRVTWRRVQPYTSATKPASYSNPGGGASYVTNGASIYLLYTATYVVSGSASQPPRTMYWTEREFRNLGRPIAIPPAKVGAVNIVFNNQFPRTVTTEYRGPGYTSPVDGNTNAVLSELRTVWYDQSQGYLYAFNQEGRVFVELLGDMREDGQTRNPLGFEIVDVVKQPIPLDLDCDLGERLVPPEGGSLADLRPEEIQQGPGVPYNHVHYAPGSTVPQLYAARATTNPNDCLVHWLETGVQGILWPKVLGRHHLVWPSDESRYSHYVRPVVETEEEAQATAVPLSPQNAPVIVYQDPLDRPRAKMTPDSKFYTYLDGSQPAHRSLLRFVVNDQVAFERVFSWLEDALRDQAFAGSVATNLTSVSNFVNVEQLQADHAAEVARLTAEYRDKMLAYQAYLVSSNQFVAAYAAYVANPAGSPPSPPAFVVQPDALKLPDAPSTNLWGNALGAPRVVNATATIGERLRPPVEEPGGTGAYLAGHINVSQGNLYLPSAYVDPLVAGIAAANKGAIIPVNRMPDNHLLEVWWFRTNSPAVGHNAANARIGLKPIYWPSYIARYELVWPASPPEIVLASKVGSGTLTPREASGVIYGQNNKELPGYNPNEEHAIMSGGTAFATRDDLNLTSGANYSSEPYVLLRYVALDARPAMSVFKVLREKPDAGQVFDYVVSAGQMVQPPPPLGFLARPVEGDGMYATDYNTEVKRTGADYPGGWDDGGDNGIYAHYDSFTWSDRKHNLWVYRATHAGQPSLAAGAYSVANKTFGGVPAATAVVGEDFHYFVHASRQDENLALVATSGLPAWLRIDGLALRGKPEASHVGSFQVGLKVVDAYDGSEVALNLALSVLSSGTVVAQGPNAITCTNTYTGTRVEFSSRPPFLAAAPTASNSFTMRFYYKTEPSFDWPGSTNPPPAGSIVPYLRPVNPTTGEFVGDPGAKETASLDIVYRPVWPVRDPKDASKPLPTLPFGATLAMPAFNLPGVRDMRTARVLYQQSVAQDIVEPAASVVLHDATREKHSDLSAAGLSQIPPSIQSESFRGNVFFPALPPHLVKRVYIEPNRGSAGSLVLKGEFNRADLGQDYTLLNVLRDAELAAVKALCPATDALNKAKWDALVDALATDLETFTENDQVPGIYMVDETKTVSVGVGDLAEVVSDETAVDSYALSATGPGSGYVTLIEANGWAFTQPGDPVSMHVFKVGGSLYTGEVKVIVAENPLSEMVSFQHTADLAGRTAEFDYEWKIAAPVNGLPPESDSTMSRYLSLASGPDIPRKTIGGAGIQSLTDNYVVMRYRPTNPSHPLYNQWSDWTDPRLAEGWIKRVLAGINPFGQRLKDLYNNAVNTDVSMLTQAGRRWEGDVALNMDTINNYGLIEIYETVLRRGRMLSIEAGFNYGPANDALLLAAGYLHDLYMILGGEAFADAANPTIGIGTKDRTYGDVATSLFAFKGQVATLAQEELALLRGRDDFLMPGVRVAPVYNRLVWNYTRGINSGEVIYALNYNVQEDNNGAPDGVINASDAAKMYPQGHGDAYGHYLTSIKGYYSLIMNQYFDWVPRIEAVNVLGVPVSVDYQDERKFASGAVSLARTGQQVVDLTWREAYEPTGEGWEHLANVRANAQRTYTSPEGTHAITRYWGLDHWASRTGQGALINWVVGNAMILPEDGDPLHEGIQKVDRTTVTELGEIATLGKAVQTSLENAEAGLSPLGIPEGGIAFDLDPNAVTGKDSATHFEQVYLRAKAALNNAVASFDDAKDVTRLMRSEEDSLAEVRTAVNQQETAHNNALIDLYGTPYPDDVGPGKTYPQGYAGPDLLHYAYVDVPESTFGGTVTLDGDNEYTLSIASLDLKVLDALAARPGAEASELDTSFYDPNKVFVFKLDKHGFLQKPENWSGRRSSPGRIQQAVSDVIKAHANLLLSVRDLSYVRNDLDNAVRTFKASEALKDEIRGINQGLNIADEVLMYAKAANEIFEGFDSMMEKTIESTGDIAGAALPDSFIAGLAAGGDITSVGEAALEAAGFAVKSSLNIAKYVRFILLKSFESANTTARRWAEFGIADKERAQGTKDALYEIGHNVWGLTDFLNGINLRLREYDDALLQYRRLLAEGQTLLDERYVARQRSAQVIQGFRTRDAAFRIFRNEKLERYKSLFDMAARYSLLAANAYDYETGLLGTKQGKDFKKRIIDSRALGVVRNGEPMFAGSNTGDPGLSSALAEMKADWDVLRGRLGFNNPDAYGTTASLRTELFRILPTSDGDSTWKDALQAARVDNLLDDPDIRRHCMQIDNGSGLPVPGIVLTFGTTVARGFNLFGRELAAGDNTFAQSAFATKIFGVGVALTGYRGMNNPALNGAGGVSPSDPPSSFLDPLAMAATPEIYLIPVGVDSMRSPPLGDTSAIRSWSVEDVAIPMPFNIGGSDFSSKNLWLASDSLTEPLFTVRKHQSFRPVSNPALFSPSLYGNNGSLLRSQFTNNRLVGRSAWNSRWKIVIPGYTLLNNPNEGLDRFIQTINDVKLHFVTYSYSGN